MARFLHYFPQYTLRDLMDGSMTLGEFFYLWGGLLDNEQPETTEPREDVIARRTREVAAAAHAAAKQAQGMR